MTERTVPPLRWYGRMLTGTFTTEEEAEQAFARLRDSVMATLGAAAEANGYTVVPEGPTKWEVVAAAGYVDPDSPATHVLLAAVPVRVR